MSTSPLIQGEILESEMSEINEDNNIQAELHQLSIMARTVLDMLENEDKTPTPLTAHFQSKPMISERSDQQDDRSQFTAGKIETARRKKNGEYGHNTVNTTQYFPSSLSSHSPTTSNNRKQLIKIVHNITNRFNTIVTSLQPNPTMNSSICPTFTCPMPTYAHIVIGKEENVERCNSAQRGERLGDSLPVNDDNDRIQEMTEPTHGEWITVSRRSTNVERPRPIHFKVNETTAKRAPTQGEVTSSPARCPSQNKFEILRDHPTGEEGDKDAVETRSDADGVAECANPANNDLTTHAEAAAQAQEESCWKDLTTSCTGQIDYFLPGPNGTPPIDYNEDWTTDEEDLAGAADPTLQSDAENMGGEQEQSIDQLYQQDPWFAGLRERGRIPFAMRKHRQEESQRSEPLDQSPADDQHIEDNPSETIEDEVEERKARVLAWFEKNPLNNETSDLLSSSSRIKIMPEEALLKRRAEEHKEKNRVTAKDRQRLRNLYQIHKPIVEIAPSAQADIALWVPLLQHQVTKRLETERGYRTLKKLFTASGNSLTAQALLDKAENDRKAFTPNISLEQWGKMVNKTISMNKSTNLQKMKVKGNKPTANNATSLQKKTPTPQPKRQSIPTSHHNLIPIKPSTLLDDIMYQMENDTSKLPTLIPTALTNIANEVVREVESKTTQITDVVDQYDIDEDTSPLLQEHQTDPSFRIFYKDIVKQINHDKKRQLKKWGLTPTQIREVTRSKEGTAKRKKLKSFKMRQKKKAKKALATAIPVVIREKQMPDLCITVQANWTIHTLIITICEARGYTRIGGQITVKSVRYNTDQCGLYLSKTGVEQGSVITHHNDFDNPNGDTDSLEGRPLMPDILEPPNTKKQRLTMDILITETGTPTITIEVNRSWRLWDLLHIICQIKGYTEEDKGRLRIHNTPIQQKDLDREIVEFDLSPPIIVNFTYGGLKGGGDPEETLESQSKKHRIEASTQEMEQDQPTQSPTPRFLMVHPGPREGNIETNASTLSKQVEIVRQFGKEVNCLQIGIIKFTDSTLINNVIQSLIKANYPLDTSDLESDLAAAIESLNDTATTQFVGDTEMKEGIIYIPLTESILLGPRKTDSTYPFNIQFKYRAKNQRVKYIRVQGAYNRRLQKREVPLCTITGIHPGDLMDDQLLHVYLYLENIIPQHENDFIIQVIVGRERLQLKGGARKEHKELPPISGKFVILLDNPGEDQVREFRRTFLQPLPADGANFQAGPYTFRIWRGGHKATKYHLESFTYPFATIYGIDLDIHNIREVFLHILTTFSGVAIASVHLRTDHSATDLRQQRILTRHHIAITLMGPRLTETERVDIEYELKIISNNDSVEVQLGYTGTPATPSPRVQSIPSQSIPAPRGNAWRATNSTPSRMEPVPAPLSTTLVQSDIRSLVRTEMATYQRKTDERIDRIETIAKSTAQEQRSITETIFAMQTMLEQINHKLGPGEEGRGGK